MSFNVSFNIFLEQSDCAFSWISKRRNYIKMHGKTVKMVVACLKVLSWHLCGRDQEDESAENRTRFFPEGLDSRPEACLWTSSLVRGERSTCSFVTPCEPACKRTRAPTGNRNDFKFNNFFQGYDAL